MASPSLMLPPGSAMIPIPLSHASSTASFQAVDRKTSSIHVKRRGRIQRPKSTFWSRSQLTVSDYCLNAILAVQVHSCVSIYSPILIHFFYYLHILMISLIVIHLNKHNIGWLEKKGVFTKWEESITGQSSSFDLIPSFPHCNSQTLPAVWLPTPHTQHAVILSK